MSTTSILLIAHAPLAHALRECALHVFPDCGSSVAALDVPPNQPPEESLAQARILLDQLGTDSTDVTGFRIAQGHIHMALAQIEVARHWDPPKDAKMIRLFLGLTNFFRGHIRDYASIAAPLN